MRIAIIFLVSMLIASCTTIMPKSTSNPTVAPTQWQGKTVAELTAALGTPGMTNLAANGNTEYIYNVTDSRPFSESFKPNAATIVAPGNTTVGVTAPNVQAQPAPALRECVVIYEVSPQGIVVTSRMRGKGC